jgi:cytochrome c556
MYQGTFLSIAVGVLFVFSDSSPLFAQEDMVQKRKDLMNNNYDALKAIKRAVEQKDYATIQTKAKDIVGNMDRVVDYFPKGSITEKSRAKPEI